jgi:hypothetical protein
MLQNMLMDWNFLSHLGMPWPVLLEYKKLQFERKISKNKSFRFKDHPILLGGNSTLKILKKYDF